MTRLLNGKSLTTDSSDPLKLPHWVSRLFPQEIASQPDTSSLGLVHQCAENEDWLLHTVAAPGIGDESPNVFQESTTRLYRYLHRSLSRHPGFFPVRLWNFIPQIHAPQGHGLDRYMVFNAGRYTAYLSYYQDARSAEQVMPTATGVGHDGQDLMVHMLAHRHAGKPVENPRQVSAYHYSQRYGPKPPCFARATIVAGGHGQKILVGGTASVVGEDSRHEHDVVAQAHETFTNLAELIRAADNTPDTPATRINAPARLARFTELRVYFARAADEATLKVLLRENFPQVLEIEWCRADLCRAELLVEIEGVAKGAD